MNTEQIKEIIHKMDVKSDEFFELYEIVSDKYYTFENPDHYQEALQMVHMWLERSANKWEDHVIVTANIVKEIFRMREKKQESCTGTVGFTDTTFFFDIYSTENERDRLHDMLRKTHKSMEDGTATFSRKGFGKKYFDKDKK